MTVAPTIATSVSGQATREDAGWAPSEPAANWRRKSDGATIRARGSVSVECVTGRVASVGPVYIVPREIEQYKKSILYITGLYRPAHSRSRSSSNAACTFG